MTLPTQTPTAGQRATHRINSELQAKRWAGRESVAARTIWSLTIRGLQLRCLANKNDFTVQVRKDGKWQPLATGGDAWTLLNRAVNARTVTMLLLPDNWRTIGAPETSPHEQLAVADARSVDLAIADEEGRGNGP